MNPRKHLTPKIIAIILLLIATHARCAEPLTIIRYKPTGIYALGETVGWNLTLPSGATPLHDCKYTIKQNNFKLIQSGDLDLSTGSAKIEVTPKEPCMLYVEITSPDLPTTRPDSNRDPHGLLVGAAVAPEKLQPNVPAPADFDDFWNSKIKLLQAVPMNAVLTPSDSGNPDIEYATIKLDNFNGTHIQGQIAKPKRDGKFPAYLFLQYAGPPYPLRKITVMDRAKEGWLALNIEPHDVLPNGPKSYYAALPDTLKNYHMIGRDDPNKCYFLQMYLADYRAVDYLASRPDWDGKTLVVSGASMGGQQGLCVAGLNPKITHLIVEVPSGCDVQGPLFGRASGYPNWPTDDPKICQTALYFDPVNFASRIKAPSLVAMGFIDAVAPPVGIYIAFNQIKAPKLVTPMVDSPHNNRSTIAQRRPFTSQQTKWLSTLVKGGQLNISETSTPADESFSPAEQPSERTDKNSQLAGSP